MTDVAMKTFLSDTHSETLQKGNISTRELTCVHVISWLTFKTLQLPLVSAGVTKQAAGKHVWQTGGQKEKSEA